MTPLAIGALLAVAAMVWAIAPIFGEEPPAESPPNSRPRDIPPEADAAAEAAIRRWREPK